MSDTFEEHRRLLFTVAYEMLGSVADAEDVVQDTWLRWSADERDDVRDPKAFLVRITTRLALNRLRTLRRRREAYVGPWLPEPLVTSADPAGAAVELGVERAEDVSMAMLVVLETLTPVERAVFVLREVFGFPHAEIAASVGRTEAAVRQLAHRAREHVQARRPRFDTDPAAQQAVTERFVAACLGGDLGALMDVLAPDVVVISDGGGQVRAARRPVEGAEKVARLLLGIAEREVPRTRMEFRKINGVPGMIGWDADTRIIAITVETAGDQVGRILIFRNPDKLAGLAGDPAN